MPKRRKHATLTQRDIENLKSISPVTWIILLGLAVGAIVFCIGVDFIFSFTGWLRNSFGLSSEFTGNLTNFALLALAALIFIGIPIILIARYNAAIEKKYRGIKIANIDAMTGIEFELYLQKLLANQGYTVLTTQVSGDLGVDLVASKNSDKIAIQAKRYNTKVSRRAVSDAVAGMYHYGCNKAMVITNYYFSPGAIALAHSTGCVLIDRDILANWVTEFQNSSS